MAGLYDLLQNPRRLRQFAQTPGNFPAALSFASQGGMAARPAARARQSTAKEDEEGVLKTGEVIDKVRLPDGTYVRPATESGQLVKAPGKSNLYLDPATGEPYQADPAQPGGIRSAWSSAKRTTREGKEFAVIPGVGERELGPDPKAAEEAAKLTAKREAENRRLAFAREKRPYNIDRITGEPVPLQSDEEWQKQKAAKQAALDQAARVKRLKTEADLLKLDARQIELETPKPAKEDEDAFTAARDALAMIAPGEDADTAAERLANAPDTGDEAALVAKQSAQAYLASREKIRPAQEAAAKVREMNIRALDLEKQALNPDAWKAEKQASLKDMTDDDLMKEATAQAEIITKQESEASDKLNKIVTQRNALVEELNAFTARRQQAEAEGLSLNERAALDQQQADMEAAIADYDDWNSEAEAEAQAALKAAADRREVLQTAGSEIENRNAVRAQTAEQAKARAAMLEKGRSLYETWGKGLYMDDWRDQPDDDARFQQEAKKAGLSLPEAKEALQTFRQLDWSNIKRDPKTAEPIEEQARLLPDGNVTVNPANLLDPEAYNAAVDAVDTTPEAKERAKAMRAELAEPVAEEAYNNLRKNADFAAWLDKNTSGTPLDRMEKFNAEMKAGGALNAALMQFLGSTAGLPSGWLGAIAGLTGSDKAMEYANWWKDRAQAYGTAAGEAGKGTNMAGRFIASVAGGLPSVMESLAVGGVAGRVLGSGAAALGAAAVDAAAQSGGNTFLDATDAYIQQGLTPEEAKAKAATPAIASGLVTAALTAIGGGGVESLLRAEGQALAKAAIKRGIAAQVGEGVADEAVEEWADQMLQGVVAQLSYDPNKPLEQVFAEATEAGLVGGVLGGGASGIRAFMDRNAPTEGAQPYTPEAPAPDGGPAPTMPTQPRPAGQENVSKIIAAFQPTGTPMPQAVNDTIKRTGRAPDQVAQAAASGLVKVAQGASLESLDAREREALGFINKDGKIVPAPKTTPLVEIYKDKLVIRNEAAEWLDDEGQPVLARQIKLDEAERKAQIDEAAAKPAKKKAGQAAPKAAESTQQAGLPAKSAGSLPAEKGSTPLPATTLSKSDDIERKKFNTKEERDAFQMDMERKGYLVYSASSWTEGGKTGYSITMGKDPKMQSKKIASGQAATISAETEPPKPSQTITGSNAEMAAEMPVPGAATEPSPGEAPTPPGPAPQAAPELEPAAGGGLTPAQAALMTPAEYKAKRKQMTDPAIWSPAVAEFEHKGMIAHAIKNGLPFSQEAAKEYGIKAMTQAQAAKATPEQKARAAKKGRAKATVPAAEVQPPAKPSAVEQPQTYLDRVLDAAIKDPSLGEITIPIPEKNQTRESINKAIQVIEQRGLTASTDGRFLIVRGLKDVRRTTTAEPAPTRQEQASQPPASQETASQPETQAAAEAKDEALKVIDAAIRRYEERSRPYEGGQGLPVGAENANDRIAADALMSMKRAVREGKDIDEALKIAIADAHEMVRNHNRRRPKDVNWQRWEGTADSILTMTAGQAKRAMAGRAQAEPVPESQTPPSPTPATEPETAGQSPAQAVKEEAQPATPLARAQESEVSQREDSYKGLPLSQSDKSTVISQTVRDAIQSGKPFIASAETLDAVESAGMLPEGWTSIPNPNRAGVKDQYLVGPVNAEQIRRFRVANNLEQPSQLERAQAALAAYQAKAVEAKKATTSQKDKNTANRQIVGAKHLAEQLAKLEGAVEYEIATAFKGAPIPSMMVIPAGKGGLLAINPAGLLDSIANNNLDAKAITKAIDKSIVHELIHKAALGRLSDARILDLYNALTPAAKEASRKLYLAQAGKNPPPLDEFQAAHEWFAQLVEARMTGEISNQALIEASDDAGFRDRLIALLRDFVAQLRDIAGLVKDKAMAEQIRAEADAVQAAAEAMAAKAGLELGRAEGGQAGDWFVGKDVDPNTNSELSEFLEDDEFDYEWKEVNLPTSIKLKAGDYLDEERIASLKKLPAAQREPVIVIQEGDQWKLVDGGHRIELAKREGLLSIKAFAGKPRPSQPAAEQADPTLWADVSRFFASMNSDSKRSAAIKALKDGTASEDAKGYLIDILENPNWTGNSRTIAPKLIARLKATMGQPAAQAQPEPSPAQAVPTAREAEPPALPPAEPYASPLAQFVGEWLGMNANQQSRVDMPQRVIRLADNQADTEAVMALVKEASAKGADGEPLFNTPHQRLYNELRETLRFMQRKSTGTEKGKVSTQIIAVPALPPTQAAAVAKEEAMPEPAKQAAPFDAAAAKGQKKFLLAEVAAAVKAAPRRAEMAQDVRDDLNRLDAIVEMFAKQDRSPITTERAAELSREAKGLNEKVRQAVGTITIEVPGDGTFTILNEKGALAQFQKRADKFPVSAIRDDMPSKPTAQAPTAVPALKKPKTTADVVAAIYPMVSGDDTRGALVKVKGDGTHLFATDGRVLVRIEQENGGGKGKEEIVYDEKGNAQPWPEDERPYDGNQAIPDDKNFTPYTLDTGRWFSLMSQARAVLKTLPGEEDSIYKSVQFYRNPDGSLGVFASDVNRGDYAHNIQPEAKFLASYNPEYVQTILRVARNLGQEQVELRIQDDVSPATFRAGPALFVLMPMRVNGAPAYSPQVQAARPAPPVTAQARPSMAEQVQQAAGAGFTETSLPKAKPAFRVRTLKGGERVIEKFEGKDKRWTRQLALRKGEQDDAWIQKWVESRNGFLMPTDEPAQAAEPSPEATTYETQQKPVESQSRSNAESTSSPNVAGAGSEPQLKPATLQSNGNNSETSAFGTAAQDDEDIQPQLLDLTPAQERLLAQLPKAEAAEALKKGLGYDRPQTTTHRLPNDPLVYLDRQGEKKLGYIDQDGRPHMLTVEESASKRQEIERFESDQKKRLGKRMEALRENARILDEQRIYQITPSGPAYYKKDGKWYERGSDRQLGRKKGDDLALQTLESANVGLYEVKVVSDGDTMYYQNVRQPSPEAQAPAEAPASQEPASIGQENVNAKHSREWAEVSTEPTMSNPKGSLKTDAIRSKTPSAPWYYQGDIRQLAFNQKVIEGGKSAATPEGAQTLKEYSAAVKDGWSYTSVRAGSYGTVYVFRKGNMVLTNAGAAALTSEAMARPEGVPEGRGGNETNTVSRLAQYSAKLMEWLQTLPESTLNSPVALSTKMRNDVLAKWVRLREPDLKPYEWQLQYLKPDGKPDVQFFEPSLEKLIKKAINYAVIHRDMPAADRDRGYGYPEFKDAPTVAETLAANGFGTAAIQPAEPSAPEAGQAGQVQPITGFESARAFISKLREGQVTAEQVRTAWAQLKAARPAILADLNKMKVDDLLPMAGISARKADGKAAIAKNVLNTLDMYFNPDDSISYGFGGDFQANKDAAMDEKVAKWTDEMIVEQARARREDAEARKAAREKAMTNPETKDEWDRFVFAKGRQALTPEEVQAIKKMKSGRNEAVIRKGESLLTPEQLAAYDAVRGIDRKAAEQARTEAQARVYGVASGVEAGIVETKHTQKGHDLFVVKLSERVERPVYDRLNAAAKKLGGYYSSYSKGGAVPGFQFTSRAAAENFIAVSKGETVDQKEQIQERQEAKKSATASRLNALADGLDAKAEGILSADRKTNTAKRAREAAGQEASARKMQAMAQTMRNLAAAMESGKATHLDGVTAGTHVDTLDGMARSAMQRWSSAKNLGYTESQKAEAEGPTAEMMDAARIPYPYIDKSTILNMVEAGRKTPGAKLLAERVAKIQMNEDDGQAVTLRREDDLENVKELAQKVYDRGRLFWDGIKWKYETYDRLKAMGLTNLPSLRAALREYLQYRGKAAKADPVKAMERELIGMKLPGFFPTPRPIIDEMIGLAGIRPGMKVLEPSAGKGDIAEAAQEAGAEVDAIELSSRLRDILQAKGINVVDNDFTTREPFAEYDAVVMNPPFENGQDIEHVQHAYKFLKEGGTLVAVMSAGPFYRQDKQATAFREWLDGQNSTYEAMPEGSFAGADAFRQTGVRAYLVTIRKPYSSMPKMADEGQSGPGLAMPPAGQAVTPGQDGDEDLESAARAAMGEAEAGQPATESEDLAETARLMDEQQRQAEAEARAREELRNDPANIAAVEASGAMAGRNLSKQFADPAARSFYQALTAAREMLGGPETVVFEEVRKWAARQLESDPAGAIAYATELADNKTIPGMEGQAVLAAVIEALNREVAMTGDKGQRLLLTRLGNYYLDLGTALAQGLGFRRDTVETPQDRWNKALRVVFGPAEKVRRRLRLAPTEAGKARRIAELEAQLASYQGSRRADIEAALAEAKRQETQESILEKEDAKNEKLKGQILGRMGLTERDLTLSPVDRYSLQTAILDLPEVREALSNYPDGRDIMRQAMRGFSDEHIANSLGLNQDDVAKFIKDATNAIIRPAVKAEVQAGRGFGDMVKSGLQSLARKVGLRMAAVSGPLGTMSPPLTAAELAKVEQEVNDILNFALQPAARRNKAGNLISKVIDTPGGKKVRVFVPFDPDDAANFYAFAREFSTAKSNVFDKLYEYWINWPLLGGPQTQVANITGNAAQLVWHYTGQRLAEAALNVAYRDPNSAQLSEFKHIATAFFRSMGPAMDMARQSFLTEGDTVRHKYLNEPMEIEFKDGSLDKLGAYRPAIGGKAGRLARLPGRLLRFADAFFKTAILHTEAAALAYRKAHAAAKAQGLTGANRAAFIDAEMANDMNNQGSDVWVKAMDTAEELLFQDENAATDLVDAMLGGHRAVRDLEKLKAEAEAKGDYEAAARISNRIFWRSVWGKIMRLIFPFQRTPTNIIKAGLRKAGGAALSGAWHATRAGLIRYKNGKSEPFTKNYTKAMQIKDLSESLLAGLGWLMLSSAFEGDDDDEKKPILIVGNRPYSPGKTGEREAFMRETGGANAILFRDKDGKTIGTFNFSRYEPVATLLSAWVDGYRNFREVNRRRSQGEPDASYLTYIGSSLFASVEGKSFLQGVSGLMETLRSFEERREPSTSNWAAKQLINAVVPNIIKQPLRNWDDLVRDTKNAGIGYTALPNPEVAPKLPSFQAEPKITTTGERIQKGYTAPARLLFQANAKVTPQPDALLLRANRLNPTKAWFPQPLQKDDFYVRAPGAKPGTPGYKTPIADPAKKRQFAELSGKFYAQAARQIEAATPPAVKAKPTPALIEAYKKAREQANARARAVGGIMGLHK